MTRVTRPPAHPALLLAAASLLIAACSGGASGAREQSSPATQSPAAMGAAADGSLPLGGAAGGRTVTLAFAGDVHFQLHLAALLDRPREALTRIRSTLGAA